MRISVAAVLGVLLAAWPPVAFAGLESRRFPAAEDRVVQLEQAAGSITGPTAESLSSKASLWPDASAAARTTPQDPVKPPEGLGPAAHDLATQETVPPGQKVRPKAPVPARLASELDDSPSEDGFYSVLSRGFLEVMSPAINLLTKGVLGKIAGSLLALVLFVPAVVVGGIHAMF